MTDKPKTAFITGGASGIGRALSERLVSKGWHIFIADQATDSAKSLVDTLNTAASKTVAHYATTDVSSWPSQLSAFQSAVKIFNNRIDFVAPIAGIGERKWIPFVKECQDMAEGEFAEPDLAVVEVDLKGPFFTVALAVQQFRRQERGVHGRGKIGIVASVCGFYCVLSVPVYTAAKHGIVGLVRSYGKLLPHEHITLSAVCPGIVRTGISTSEFYEGVEKEGLLVPMESMMLAFDDIIDGEESGNVYECGPSGGFVKRESEGYPDDKTFKSMELVKQRAWPLHYPPSD